MESQTPQNPNMHTTPPSDEIKPSLPAYSTKRQVVIALALILAYPVGVMLLWALLKKWSIKRKIIISALLSFPFIIVTSLVIANQQAQYEKDHGFTNLTIQTPTPSLSPTSTSKSTASWKTYSDENFTAKYPNMWATLNYKDGDNNNISFYSPCSPAVCKGDSGSKITVSSIPNPQKLTMQEFLVSEQGLQLLPPISRNTIKLSIALVDKQTVVSKKYFSQAGPVNSKTFVSNKDKFFLIDCSECEDSFNNLFLSTFKFTK